MLLEFANRILKSRATPRCDDLDRDAYQEGSLFSTQMRYNGKKYTKIKERSHVNRRREVLPDERRADSRRDVGEGGQRCDSAGDPSRHVGVLAYLCPTCSSLCTEAHGLRP